MEFKSHQMSSQNECPQCHKILDAATGVEGARPPKPNDFTVCVYCQSWLLFTDDLGLRLATDEDTAKLSGEQLYMLRMITEHFANRG